jgi:hypothetical protein
MSKSLKKSETIECSIWNVKKNYFRAAEIGKGQISLFGLIKN